MIEMLKIFERIIKGKQQILEDNQKKYGLYPYNVKACWKDISYKKLYFITKSGDTLMFNINRDFLDVFEFLTNSDMFIWVQDRYINVSMVKSTRRYFAKKPYKLRIYFTDNSKIELSDNFQNYHLKYLNNKIRALMKDLLN